MPTLILKDMDLHLRREAVSLEQAYPVAVPQAEAQLHGAHTDTTLPLLHGRWVSSRLFSRAARDRRRS